MTVLQWLPWCAVLTAFTCTLTQWAVNCWYRYLLLESIEKWLLFVFENPGKVLEILVTYCGHFAWELLYWVMQCSLCDGLSDVCIEVATQHRMIILVSVNVATQLKAIKWIESEISFNKSYVTYILRHSCFCYVDFILLTYFLAPCLCWLIYLFIVCVCCRSLIASSRCSRAFTRCWSAKHSLLIGWHTEFPSQPVWLPLSSHWSTLGVQRQQRLVGHAWRVMDVLSMFMTHSMVWWRLVLATATPSWCVLYSFQFTYLTYYCLTVLSLYTWRWFVSKFFRSNSANA